ncbi:hypothetical protein B296_00033979, partial [Ensete ventricosum]
YWTNSLEESRFPTCAELENHLDSVTAPDLPWRRYNARAPRISFEDRLRRFKNCGLEEFDRTVVASMNLSFFFLVILFLSRPAQSVDPYKVPYFLLLGFVFVPLGLGLWLPHLEPIQFLFFPSVAFARRINGMSKEYVGKSWSAKYKIS